MGSSIWVLLVDDDAGVRQAASAVLKFLGCRVVACSSSPQALRRAREGRPFEVSLVALMLREDDGVDLIMQMEQEQIGGAKILMSRYALDRQRLPGQVAQVLRKPLKLDAVATALSRVGVLHPPRLRAVGMTGLARRIESTAPPAIAPPVQKPESPSQPSYRQGRWSGA